MKLYYSPGASSLAPRIIAFEAGLNIEYDKVDLKTQTTASGRSFSRINPKGDVPALALPSGEILAEVPVILEYLADQAPSAQLLPNLGSWERYQVKEWLDFTGSELHKGFDPLWEAPQLPKARELAVCHLRKRIAYVDQCLRGQLYLTGQRFTVADAYCYTILSWARFHRIDLTGHGMVLEYMRRITDRPMVRRALQSEGLPIAA
ncbi:glutathione transferase GstA [Microvirga lotononidis]|uniref:Glutathione S-transferase n=1 Tax=Microvirga lotononidis TaxID=864069 RepID=I4YKH5_9HYPH|nr:glutathione transferase GstA [Microvirga lotononidis]EIM24467.1 glutathione S-transferase [Microvirga lotononidis]WQO26496.1 glutathione transferase GstA [Microvirga lotononidis]